MSPPTTLSELLKVYKDGSTPSDSQFSTTILPLLKRLERVSPSPLAAKTPADPLTALDPLLAPAAMLYVLVARLRDGDREPATHAKVGDWVGKALRGPRAGEVYSCGDQALFTLLSHRVNPQDFVALTIPFLGAYARIGTLTALHPLILQAVIASRQYQNGAGLAIHPITDIDPQNFPIRYQDHLAYQYQAGIILAIVGETEKAIDCLEACITAPGPSVSHIQIDASRVHLLVSLLLPVPPAPVFPRSAPTVTGLLDPYTSFRDIWLKEKSTEMVTKAAHERHEIFVADHMVGLVMKTIHAHQRKAIHRLKGIYKTVQIKEGDTILGVVQQMITRGELRANLSGTMLEFLDDDDSYATAETVQKLEKAIWTTAKWDKVFKYRERDLECGKDYVSKVYVAAQNPSAASAAVGGGGGLGPLGIGGFGFAMDDEGGLGDPRRHAADGTWDEADD